MYKEAASHNILNPGHAGAAADPRLYDAAALHIRCKKYWDEENKQYFGDLASIWQSHDNMENKG